MTQIDDARIKAVASLSERAERAARLLELLAATNHVRRAEIADCVRELRTSISDCRILNV